MASCKKISVLTKSEHTDIRGMPILTANESHLRSSSFSARSCAILPIGKGSLRTSSLRAIVRANPNPIFNQNEGQHMYLRRKPHKQLLHGQQVVARRMTSGQCGAAPIGKVPPKTALVSCWNRFNKRETATPRFPKSATKALEHDEMLRFQKLCAVELWEWDQLQVDLAAGRYACSEVLFSIVAPLLHVRQPHMKNVIQWCKQACGRMPLADIMSRIDIAGARLIQCNGQKNLLRCCRSASRPLAVLGKWTCSLLQDYLPKKIDESNKLLLSEGTQGDETNQFQDSALDRNLPLPEEMHGNEANKLLDASLDKGQKLVESMEPQVDDGPNAAEDGISGHSQVAFVDSLLKENIQLKQRLAEQQRLLDQSTEQTVLPTTKMCQSPLQATPRHSDVSTISGSRRSTLDPALLDLGRQHDRSRTGVPPLFTTRSVYCPRNVEQHGVFRTTSAGVLSEQSRPRVFRSISVDSGWTERCNVRVLLKDPPPTPCGPLTASACFPHSHLAAGLSPTGGPPMSADIYVLDHDADSTNRPIEPLCHKPVQNSPKISCTSFVSPMASDPSACSDEMPALSSPTHARSHSQNQCSLTSSWSPCPPSPRSMLFGYASNPSSGRCSPRSPYSVSPNNRSFSSVGALPRGIPQSPGRMYNNQSTNLSREQSVRLIEYIERPSSEVDLGDQFWPDSPLYSSERNLQRQVSIRLVQPGAFSYPTESAITPTSVRVITSSMQLASALCTSESPSPCISNITRTPVLPSRSPQVLSPRASCPRETLCLTSPQIDLRPNPASNEPVQTPVTESPRAGAGSQKVPISPSFNGRILSDVDSNSCKSNKERDLQFRHFRTPSVDSSFSTFSLPTTPYCTKRTVNPSQPHKYKPSLRTNFEQRGEKAQVTTTTNGPARNASIMKPNTLWSRSGFTSNRPTINRFMTNPTPVWGTPVNWTNTPYPLQRDQYQPLNLHQLHFYPEVPQNVTHSRTISLAVGELTQSMK